MAKPNKLAQLVVVLFVRPQPISGVELTELLKIAPKDLVKLVAQSQQQLSAIGLVITKTNQHYQLATKPDYAELAGQLTKKTSENLSRTNLEVLSIVAYNQPISRTELDSIRGVNSEASLRILIQKGLVSESKAGSQLSPNYEITNRFLQLVGLTSLDQLPQLKDQSNEN